MKVVFFFCVGAFALPANADESVTGHGHHANLRLKKDPESNAANTLGGHCEVRVGPGQPIASDCVTILLVLSDEKGVEVARTRTNAKGVFSFAVKPNQKFVISSGSHFYQVVTPKSPVSSGQNVAVTLEQK